MSNKIQAEVSYHVSRDLFQDWRIPFEIAGFTISPFSAKDDKGFRTRWCIQIQDERVAILEFSEFASDSSLYYCKTRTSVLGSIIHHSLVGSGASEAKLTCEVVSADPSRYRELLLSTLGFRVLFVFDRVFGRRERNLFLRNLSPSRQFRETVISGDFSAYRSGRNIFATSGLCSCSARKKVSSFLALDVDIVETRHISSGVCRYIDVEEVVS